MEALLLVSKLGAFIVVCLGQVLEAIMRWRFTTVAAAF